MINIKQEILKTKSGFLILVKLLNKYEIDIIFPKSSQAIEQFHDIVSNICKNTPNCKFMTSPDQSELYIILDDNRGAVKDLANFLYYSIQLHVDDQNPEIYFKCIIGSVQYNENRYFTPDQLIALLKYGAIQLTDKLYYYDYDEHLIAHRQLKSNYLKLNFLKSSLLQKKAKFVYQPIINNYSKKIEYHECLLRVFEDGRYISVTDIIKSAESEGLINVIDVAVAEMAIKELQQNPNITLGINISNIGFLNQELLAKIEILLKKFNVAKRLVIEITETSINSDYENIAKFISTLKSYGCRFALDDFGSGFTSFQQIEKLPIDIIKIDGTYIKNILKNEYNKIFVKALIQLAKTLKLKTVAEFVENSEIAEFLEKMEIDCMQGNFLQPASREKILEI